jgi:predicted nucleic acid-binding protein
MAGLLKDSLSRKIILDDHFSFYAPDYIGTELLKHRTYLMKKAKLSVPDFTLLLHILLSRVTLVPFKDFEPDFHRAMQIMKPIDEKDAPFLAVGLSLGLDAIWTEDRHFLLQDVLKVYTTSDLIEYI